MIAVCHCLSMLVVAQQNEGTVVYQMVIEGLPPEQASMMGDMEMKIIWKDGKSYVEQHSMMHTTQSVSDGKTGLVLIDAMGNKTYMKWDVNDPKYQEKEKEVVDYKIEYTNDTKKIAGYDCKKAIVTVKTKDKKDVKIDVWYTEQVPNVYAQHKHRSKNQNADYLKGINGMPLEYKMLQDQITVRVTAKELNFNPVSDEVFHLSTEGYTEVKYGDKIKAGN